MTRRTGIAFVLAAAVVLSTAGVAAGASQPIADADPDGPIQAPAFVVDLATDGSASVTVTYTFDLTDDVRRQAFEELASNETTKAAFRDRFRTRLAGVAIDAANVTGREMSIGDVSVETHTEGETGVVVLSATWDGLAAVEGDRLVVTEPFASGFTTERAFVVRPPDGYAIDSVMPAPDDRNDGRLTWQSGTSLDGFEVTMTATGSGDGGDAASETDGNDGTDAPGGAGPGFGVLAALLAVIAAILVAGGQLR